MITPHGVQSFKPPIEDFLWGDGKMHASCKLQNKASINRFSNFFRAIDKSIVETGDLIWLKNKPYILKFDVELTGKTLLAKNFTYQFEPKEGPVMFMYYIDKTDINTRGVGVIYFDGKRYGFVP